MSLVTASAAERDRACLYLFGLTRNLFQAVLARINWTRPTLYIGCTGHTCWSLQCVAGGSIPTKMCMISGRDQMSEIWAETTEVSR